MAYPVFCSTCGKHVGNVMDKARQNDVFYCRDHAPASAAKIVLGQDEPAMELKAEPVKANKRRLPKANK